MTRTTSSLVEKNLQLMASALEDINEITDRLGRSSREDVERLSAILKNTASLTERMDRLLAENDQGLSETLTGMRDGMAKLNAALDDVRSVTAKINSGEGNVGKLVNDDRLYDKIVGISTQVEEYVNSTIGMDLQVAFQSDYLLSAGEARSQFGLRLEPRGKNKYYALGLVARRPQAPTTSPTKPKDSGSFSSTPRLPGASASSPSGEGPSRAPPAWGWISSPPRGSPSRRRSSISGRKKGPISGFPASCTPSSIPPWPTR